MNLNELKQKMDQANYIYDDTLATTVYVALTLGRPLLLQMCNSHYLDVH